MGLLRCTMTLLCIATAGVAVGQEHSALPHPQAALSGARLLSDAGRRDARAVARAVGEAMRAMKLAVSEVISSPYCRTMETARLMFGRAEASRDAIGNMTPTGKPDYTALERILATPPTDATLRAVVSHGNPFQAIAGEPLLAEGEAAVIRGDGVRWIIVARIPIAAWLSLVAAGD